MQRRDFFKYGVGGAGLALGAGFSVTVQGETASRLGPHAHPWWVKEIERPKLPIQDDVYARFDASMNVFGSFTKYYGLDNAKALRERSRELELRYYRENRPGYRLQDHALADAAWTVSRAGGLNRGLRTWTRKSVPSPADRGFEKYQGTPEEAARLVKQAARYFGAATTGIAPLDRRHIHSREMGKDIVFEPVEEPYDGPEKLVIPDACRYAVAVSIHMSLDAVQCSPTAIGSAGASLGYSRAEFLVASLAEFIRGLGYVAIPSVNDLGSSVAIAVDAGLGELSRMNRLVTPEFGPNVRLAKVLTDLPLAVDKPIDFGLLEFCKVCKRCAEACHPKALSFDDEPTFEVKGEWNNPGHKAWFEDEPKCFAYWQESVSGCSICVGVCPWSKKDKTMIHEIVKAASMKIPALDGFFTTMDKAFGYGRPRDAADWWSLDIPEYGIDTSPRRG